MDVGSADFIRYNAAYPADHYGRRIGYMRTVITPKGFGFLTPNPELVGTNGKDSNDLFCHFNEFKPRAVFGPGTRIQFRLNWSENNGTWRAVDCVALPVEDAHPSVQP